jgi:hypothetical protein
LHGANEVKRPAAVRGPAVGAAGVGPDRPGPVSCRRRYLMISSGPMKVVGSQVEMPGT